ncbi:hypothetical protein F0U62_20690 [Cystobacter fuscus]|uniref:hypothetical protein n=1 Tax=Cystobacter fuscus TaxID=43 RepID=UPI002B2AA7C1|nr:hypothetical protein F0U62_20690 [Cystobacter fuscus]
MPLTTTIFREELAMRSDDSLLRVVSMMADLETRCDLLGNEARLRIAEEVMDWAKDSARAHLAVFPAGYFSVSNLTEGRTLFKTVLRQAEQRHLAVVLGVDKCASGTTAKASSKTGREDIDLLVEKGQLPFWLFAWAPGMPAHAEWRQRSTTGHNGWLAPSPECSERRLLSINGHLVDVVACGEGFNRTLRASIGQEPRKSSAVVIAAHTSKGSRIWNATRHFANDLRQPTLLSVHQVGIQYGEMRLPGSANYARAEVTRSFGSTPSIHAGAFTVPIHA